MAIRAWWYTRGDPKRIPLDVREYIIRRYIRTMSEANLTLQQKSKFSENLYMGIVGLDARQLSNELRNEMAALSSNLLGQIPLDHCVHCKRPVFIHESVKTETGYLCGECKDEKPSS